MQSAVVLFVIIKYTIFYIYLRYEKQPDNQGNNFCIYCCCNAIYAKR